LISNHRVAFVSKVSVGPIFHKSEYGFFCGCFDGCFDIL